LAGILRNMPILPSSARSGGGTLGSVIIAYCPAHGCEVLLSERRIRAMSATEDALLVEVECYDGERILIVTGRESHARRTSTANA